MSKEKLFSLVEELSGDVVLLDPDDIPALGKFLNKLDELEAGVESLGNDIVKMVERVKKDVEKVVLDEVKDKRKVIEEVSKVIGELQYKIRDVVKTTGEGVDKGSKEQESKNKEIKKEEEVSVDLPEGVDKEIFEEFLESQDSRLQEMESLILDYENTGNRESLRGIKRIIHTIKGEAGLVGLNDVNLVCHKLEDILDNDISLDVDVLYRVKDWLDEVFAYYSGRRESFTDSQKILDLLEEGGIRSEVEKTEEKVAREEPSGAEKERESEGSRENIESEELVSTEEIKVFEPYKVDTELLPDFIHEANEHIEQADLNLLTIENDPSNQEALNAVFRAFHTVKGVAGFIGLKEIQELAHRAESLLDKARNRKILLAGDAIDIVFKAVDKLKGMMQELEEVGSDGLIKPQEEDFIELLREIDSFTSGRVVKESVQETRGQERVSEGTVGEVRESTKEKEEATEAVGPGRKETEEPGERDMKEVKKIKVKEMIRIDADRLDRLVDTIGELVIAESMVVQSPEMQSIGSARLSKYVSQLDKITRELQELGTSLRMIPIKSTFQRMARLVRDLSKKSGKDIEFVMTGEDTELDKSVVDRIGDPLIHMIRNAIDHGIEDSPEERRKLGKPEKGRIELNAYHKGGSIIIEVIDDGRGLDREAILKKAREKGLVKDGRELTDNEVWNLIFMPGFSTARVVSDVSGRGVGMDVVKKNIEALRGRVEISTKKGYGTTFRLILPLTLAIIDGMVIKVGNEKYIIPTLSVVTTFRPGNGEISTLFEKGEMIKLHGELMPLLRLYKLFEIEGAIEDPYSALIVVVESENMKVGIMADDLLGQQQIVIKPLGELLKRVPGISGGAIMPDGKVGLILDISGLIKLSKEVGAYNNRKEVRSCNNQSN